MQLFLILDEGAINEGEAAITVSERAIISRLCAIINDERAIIGLNEQKNFSSASLNPNNTLI